MTFFRESDSHAIDPGRAAGFEGLVGVQRQKELSLGKFFSNRSNGWSQLSCGSRGIMREQSAQRTEWLEGPEFLAEQQRLGEVQRWVEKSSITPRPSVFMP
jgi:hypothetical protein